LEATIEAAAIQVPTDEPTAETSQPVPDAQETVERRRSRIFGRKKAGRAFIDRPGKCVICSTAWTASSVEELDESGWLIRDDVALCASCQHEGWAYPEGAALPFRSNVEQQA
jgi:hypothetical protein